MPLKFDRDVQNWALMRKHSTIVLHFCRDICQNVHSRHCAELQTDNGPDTMASCKEKENKLVK